MRTAVPVLVTCAVLAVGCGGEEPVAVTLPEVCAQVGRVLPAEAPTEQGAYAELLGELAILYDAAGPQAQEVLVGLVDPLNEASRVLGDGEQGLRAAERSYGAGLDALADGCRPAS